MDFKIHSLFLKETARVSKVPLPFPYLLHMLRIPAALLLFRIWDWVYKVPTAVAKDSTDSKPL